jgi:hypothetical protein
VFIETQGGSGLDFHFENKLGVIGRRGWDAVVMHGYSTLDADRPGDAAKLIATSQQMAEFLRTRNPSVDVYLMATWSRAMQTGVADPNPYDGIEPGKLNLWTYDHYHGSAHGYYLEALVTFGSLTGRDPRSLGENECSAYELGFSRSEVNALQQVAFDQLASTGAVTPAPLVLPRPVNAERCVQGP